MKLKEYAFLITAFAIITLAGFLVQFMNWNLAGFFSGLISGFGMIGIATMVVFFVVDKLGINM